MPRLLLLLFAFTVASLAASPAVAQSMPGWAEPSSPAAPAPSATMGPGVPGGGAGVGGGATTKVPIDGGLGLLALAGGAYAIRRLRSRE